MRSAFRLLPLTMICALMLLAVKIGATLHDGQAIFQAFLVGDVKAETETKTEPKPEVKAIPEVADDKPHNLGALTPAAGTEKPADDEGKAADVSLPPAGTAAAEGNRTKQENLRENLVGNQLGGLRPDDRRFSPVELELLQQLSKRREELDEREKQFLVRENLLTQTERRIDDKFAEMEKLKETLTVLLARYDEQENTKIKSLVKIYESMKPKDAARIFDEMEMPILLMVIDKMSEKKAAPILANMDSKKAKQVTVELADEMRLQDAALKSTRKNSTGGAGAVSQ